jgi:hypothetical protein
MSSQILKSLITHFNLVAPVILALELARLAWMPGLGAGIIPRFPLPTGITWLWTYRLDYYRTTKKWLTTLKATSQTQLHTFNLLQVPSEAKNTAAA